MPGGTLRQPRRRDRYRDCDVVRSPGRGPLPGDRRPDAGRAPTSVAGTPPLVVDARPRCRAPAGRGLRGLPDRPDRRPRLRPAHGVVRTAPGLLLRQRPPAGDVDRGGGAGLEHGRRGPQPGHAHGRLGAADGHGRDRRPTDRAHRQAAARERRRHPRVPRRRHRAARATRLDDLDRRHPDRRRQPLPVRPGDAPAQGRGGGRRARARRRDGGGDDARPEGEFESFWAGEPGGEATGELPVVVDAPDADAQLAALESAPLPAIDATNPTSRPSSRRRSRPRRPPSRNRCANPRPSPR